MLKKRIILFNLLSFFHPILQCLPQKKIAPHIQAVTFDAVNKAQKFDLLNKIAEHINRLAPLDQYTITVPPFFIVTDRDIFQSLAAISDQPLTQEAASQKKRSRAAKTVSILETLEQTWRSVRASLKRDKATNKTYRLLEKMRDIIDIAFSSEQIVFNNPAFIDFMQKAQSNNIPLIVRMATDHPTLGPKSVYPAEATAIYKAIGQMFKTYYQDITIDQLIEQEALPVDLYGTVILQHFITSDDLTAPLASGFSCSQDRVSGAAHISVIETVYGHHAGFKHEMVAQDTYYIYDNIVIPVIRNKEYRLEPNSENLDTSLTKNNSIIAQTATLDAHAAQEIAKATVLLAQASKKPICLSFIKRHNTVYLIDFHYVSKVSATHTNYIDPLYIKKAIKDGAVHTVSLKPLHHIITVRNSKQILFGTNISDLLQQYNSTVDHDDILVAVIKHRPSPWSKEQKIVDELPFVTLWSSSPDNIKEWVKQRAWPLVIDPQTQLMFPYKRRKNFCTLFQTITSGLNGYPLPENISMINSFFAPLTATQKELLRPNEFFSGVTMGYLFGLLKNEQPEVALQALRTIMYRLQTRTKRASLMLAQNDPESLNQDARAILQILETQYEQVLTIGYKLYTMMLQKLKTNNKLSAHDQELLFLIDVFQKMIVQVPTDTIVNAHSFNTLFEQM